jgi:type II secretory pathway pseudopilin PulG
MSLRRSISRRCDDDGVALVISMMVVGIVITLSMLVVTVAIKTGNQSGRDRQRTVAVNAAEAAVDATYATVQTSGVALPCSWPDPGNPAVTAPVHAFPDAATARATVTYNRADGSPLGHCPGVADTGVNAPVQAVVDGYGRTNPLAGAPATTRHMQALIDITPVPGSSLDKAIFAQGSLAFKNRATLTGTSGGPDADVYTNSNFDCANNENFAGSIYSQGNVSIQGSCTITGDAWAKGTVSNTDSASPPHTADANGAITGRVLSSQASIALPNNLKVGASLLAAGTINWGGCSASGKCLPNQTVALPPMHPFPILRGDNATIAKWTGYDLFDENTCSGIESKIKSIYAPRPGKTLVRTTCPVKFTDNIAFNGDLAIFAAGFSTTSNVVFSSSGTGVPRLLYWVEPYSDLSPCATPGSGITADTRFTYTGDISMFLYSQCPITINNNSDWRGQIFGGGSVTMQQQFTMKYVQMPLYDSVDPASQPVVSYKIDIRYKRETR